MRSSFTGRGTGRLFGAVLSFVLLFQLVIFQVQVPVTQAAVFNIPNGDVAALKAALTAPNPPHVINLAAGGMYELTTVDNDIGNYGRNGLPIISRTIVINGNGAVIRTQANSNLRIFFVEEGGNLTLNNLSLANSQLDLYSGTALYNNGGSVTFSGVNVTNNRTLRAVGAVVNGVVAKNGAGTYVTATMTINDSTFSGNYSDGNGGAIVNGTNYTLSSLGSAAAILTINNSTFISNTTPQGDGAIANTNGTLVVNNSQFIRNSSKSGGGAISNYSIVKAQSNSRVNSTVAINNSSFISNTTEFLGGGAILNATIPYAGSSAVNSSATANLTVTNSTFVSNTSILDGGAIINFAYYPQTQYVGSISSTTTIANSTFTKNGGDSIVTNLRQGGTDNNSSNALLQIANSTFANNTISNTNGTIEAVNLSGSGTIATKLDNNLLSNNMGSNCAITGTTFIGTNNLEYTGAAGAPTCGAGSTVTTVNPLSAAGLANNGGPTQTIALSGNSPAKDAGNNAVCADPATVNNRDQRGVTRPQGTACDIGAYEAGGNPSFVVTTTDDNAANPPAGSLREKVAQAASVPNAIITFDPALGASPQITLAASLNMNGNFVVQGSCDNKVRLNATFANAVQLQGGVTLQGIEIVSTTGPVLTATTGKNELVCSIVRKS